jgi:hypothetical protein
MAASSKRWNGKRNGLRKQAEYKTAVMLQSPILGGRRITAKNPDG